MAVGGDAGERFISGRRYEPELMFRRIASREFS
jgi:hypothetical protein